MAHLNSGCPRAEDPRRSRGYPRMHGPSPSASSDRSDRGKLAISGDEARARRSTAIVTNEVEGLEPGTGVLAAVLTPKGKMLGDVRILDTGDELLLDMERAALQAVFDAVRHGLVGYRAELHKRTLAARPAVARRRRRPRGRRRAATCRRPSTPTSPATIGGAPVRVIATDLGVDVLCDAADTDARARGARGRRRRRRCARPTRRSCASSPAARATASTSTTASSRRRPGSTSAR